MKLILEEPQSKALRRLVEAEVRVTSSELLFAEIPRALRRRATSDPSIDARDVLTRGESQLAAVDLLAATRSILVLAGALEGPFLRALDAIHVATAVSYPGELRAFVSYDERQLEAAEGAALQVASPGG